MLKEIRIKTLLAAFILIAGYAQAATEETVTIAQNGVAKAVIVIAKDATEPERHAANELAGFLRQITGAKFEIQAPPAAGQSRLAVVDFSTEGLRSDGIVIRTVGNDLILAGDRPRGTLYAVYTFLEEQIGCRWWSSKASTIPIKPTLRIDRLNVRYVPPLEYRESFWFDAFDGDWAVRNKSNGNSERLDDKRGGKHIYEGFVHTFFPLIPPKTIPNGSAKSKANAATSERSFA
jgi:hypothetical protein